MRDWRRFALGFAFAAFLWLSFVLMVVPRNRRLSLREIEEMTDLKLPEGSQLEGSLLSYSLMGVGRTIAAKIVLPSTPPEKLSAHLHAVDGDWDFSWHLAGRPPEWWSPEEAPHLEVLIRPGPLDKQLYIGIETRSGGEGSVAYVKWWGG